MRRKIIAALLAWKNRPGHKPLVLQGARQVGKSYILEAFGSAHYDNYVHVSLDLMPDVRQFLAKDIDPHDILSYLETLYQTRILPRRTLVIFDEIQACKRALLSLKYFCEKAPEYDIAAAGSLLGVALSQDEKEQQETYSYPVGKVDELSLFPMDFEEFLWATGNELLAEQIREHFGTGQPFTEEMHNLALTLYQKYLVVGGMPESVGKFVESGSYLAAQVVQRTIMEQYIRDMSKYAAPATAIKIRACYSSIPAQLAKENRKFQYKVVQKGGTAAIFGEAIEWLVQAGILLKCDLVTHGYLPVKAYTDLSDFKLYMGDVGMLVMQSQMPAALLLSPFDADNTFMGAIAENYVAQALTACGHSLFYWKNDNTAELDFILQEEADVIPVEVKKGKRVSARSMSQFREKYHCPKAVRISKKNFGLTGGIRSVPLYAVFCM